MEFMHKIKDIDQNLTLFALAHLHVLCPISTIDPTCVLFSSTNDMHVIGLVSNVLVFFQL
jgi:hypothetical protein